MATRNSTKKAAHAVVNARADYVLGLLGGVANTPPQPSKEAMQYYAREAAEGNPDAQYRLAKLLVEGQVLSTNNRAALKWLKKAVEKEHAASQHLLGQMYLNGRGVTRDLDRAMELFRQAAISGYAEAEYDLGCALMDGAQGRKDPYQALRWFRLAGAQGHIASQYRVGYALAHGEGWLRKASINNEPRAQYEFALLFVRPDYPKHNEEEAMRWMKLSAKAGYAPAQYELAMFYQNGVGTLASYDEAFRWAWRAASQEEHKALLLLANLFRFGAGVERNLLAAYALTSYLSQKDSDASIMALLEALERQLTANDRASAQKLLSGVKSARELLDTVKNPAN